MMMPALVSRSSNVSSTSIPIFISNDDLMIMYCILLTFQYLQDIHFQLISQYYKQKLLSQKLINNKIIND